MDISDTLTTRSDVFKKIFMVLLEVTFEGREGSSTNETSPDHPQRNARTTSPASSTDETSHDHQQHEEREITIANYHRLATHILQHHPVEFVSLVCARCVLCGKPGEGTGYQCLSCEFVLHEQCLNAITGYIDEMAAACARFARSGGRRVQINHPSSPQTQLRSFNVQDGRSIQDSDSESFTTAVSHQRQLRTEESFISRNGSIPDSDYESFTTDIRDGVDAWVTASSSTLNMGSGSSHSDSVSEIETGTSEITEAAETDPRLRFATESGGYGRATGDRSLIRQQITDAAIQAAVEAFVLEFIRRFFDSL